MPPRYGELGPAGEEESDFWFDEPDLNDRRSWAVPSGHGIRDGIDLEYLDPGDDDDLMMLIEAHHDEYQDALESGTELIADGEPFSPRLHVAMHEVVAKQILADNPPDTWRTVRRLAGLGYDWHNIMHMIASLLTEDIYWILKENRPFDPAVYVGRLDQLPGDWPLP